MHTTNEHMTRAAAALLALALSGCSTEQPTSGTVTGHVTHRDGTPARDAVVTVHRVDAQGAIHTVDGATATTDAGGAYALELELDAHADIIVRAALDGEAEGAVAVDGAFSADGALTAPPIELGNTVLVDVYVEARASAAWDARFSPGLLRLFIDQRTEARVNASASYREDVLGAANAAVAGLSAWVALLADEATTAANDDMTAALELAAIAEAELNAQLDAAGTEQARIAALDAYAQAFVDAHSQAGIADDELALAATAMARATAVYSTAVDAEARAALLVTVESVRAPCVRRAIDGALSEAIDGTQGALDGAEAELHARLSAAADAGARADEDITEAWIAFRADLEAVIAASLGMSREAIGSLQSTLQATLAELASAWADLSAALSMAATIEIVVDELVAFYATVVTSIDARVLADTGLTQAQVESVLRALALAYACAA